MGLEGPWAPVGKDAAVRVVLLDFKGALRHSWEASLERFDEKQLVLRAISKRELRFDEVTIDAGDEVLQYFPRNEWFSIQEYLTAQHQIKGWYCNIAAPPIIEGSTITTRDMIVDLFVWPDCRYKVLDLDELDERKSLLEPMTIARIYEARDRLVHMVDRREPPFDRQGQSYV